MQFEWDEGKRGRNIEKHGFDFIRAPELFMAEHVRKRAHDGEDGEERWMATEIIRDRCATVIYTMRGEMIRIISIRRAREDERRDHQAIFG